jgi:pantothenate synthetase
MAIKLKVHGHILAVIDEAAFLIIDPDTPEPVQTIRPGKLITIAAQVGPTRLIDNFLVP